MAKSPDNIRASGGLPEGLLTATAQGCKLRVKVAPGARHQRVAGIVGNALKIAVTAPPERGAANGQLLAFLAELFHLPKSQVVLRSGLASREKVVELQGVPLATGAELLQKVLVSDT